VSLFLACGVGSSDRAPLLRPIAAGELAATAVASPPPLRAVEAGGLEGFDHASKVAFDASGARILYVESFGAGAEFLQDHIERRSAGGELAWALQGAFRLSGVGPNGEVFVGVLDETRYVRRLRKVGVDGQTKWEIEARSYDVLPLSDGGAVVEDHGFGLLRRLDADGVETMARTFRCDGCGLAPTTDDGVAVLANYEIGRDAVCAVVKLGADLREQWRTELPGRGMRLVAAPDGAIVLHLGDPLGPDGALASIDAGGAVRFRRELPHEEWGTLGQSIAVDREGRIALTAHGFALEGMPSLKYVHVLDPSGELLWTASTDAALTIHSAAFDPSGRLAIVGSYEETDFLGGHHVPLGPSDAFYLQFER
jgi:hypothetical protein